MRNTQDVRRLFVRKLFKIHAVALFVSMGVYFVFAFFDPGLLSYDWRQKFHALAADTIVVTATVLGPPAQPVVTAVSDCDETSGILSIDLDWADDGGTTSYDIDRDSLALVSGLVSSAYHDTGVLPATTYQYEVIANGPMGPGLATSLPVSVVTPTTCEVTAATPAVSIVSFAGRGVDSYDGRPRVGNRRPLFTGTTSMPNATIVVTIGTHFVAEFSANANGYWEWKPPYGITSGSHVFTVTATDLADSTRQATASLRFDILKRDDGAAKKDDVPTVPPSIDVDFSIPLDFTLSIEDENATVLQGEMLHSVLSIGFLEHRYEHLTVPIRYSVIDEKRGVIFSETYRTYIAEGNVIKESFPIPMYILPGSYHLQAEVLLDTLNISRSTSFTVKELPLVRLSSGGSISYADVVRNLGWIVFFGLFLFFLWIFLFIREFALYLQGDGKVTEYDLKKAGLIRK